MSIRTFIDAPASSTKDWPARNKENTMTSPTWLACDIANFWLKVIWLKGFLFG
jgi:hypothetical protein